MDRLSIASLEVEQFGGWTRRRLLLPSDRFVVVHGHNETGKSTAAELIAWLLAGPRGSAVDAQRFGGAGDSIGGVLSGQLGAEPFEATGRFRVLKAGAPNLTGLSVNLGVALTAAQWRLRLGGVDDQVLAAIYRLSGDDLHHGIGVEQHLSRVALAALGSRVDPRSLVRQLSEDARRFTTAKAVESDSVLRCRERIQAVDHQIAAASTNADDYAAVQVEIEQYERRRRGIHERQLTAARRSGAIATVLGTVELRARAADDEAALAALDPVPAAWSVLAADPDGVEHAVALARQSEQVCSAAEAGLVAVQQELGMGEATIAGISITDAVLAEVTRLTTMLEQADATLVTTAEAEVRSRAALADGTHRADAALGATGGATRAEVLTALFDAQPRADLAQAVLAWRSAIVTGDQCHRAHQESQTVAGRVGHELRTAEAAWARWGQGRTPQEWQLAHRTAATTSATHRGLPWWTPAAAIAAIAGVAIVLSAPVVAGLAALVAVVVLALSRPRATPPADALEPDLEVAASADALIAAQGRRADSALAVITAEGAVNAAAANLARVHRELRDLARSLHVPIAETPEATTALHQTWVGAATAVRAERDLEQQLEGALASVEQAMAQVGSAEAAVRDALSACGVTVAVPPRASAAMIGRFRAAGVTYREVVAARSAALGARAAMDELLAPVAADTMGWRPERVAEEVRRWSTVQKDVAVLVASIATTRKLIEIRLGDEAEVRALFERGLSRFELESEARDADAERLDVQEDSDGVGERIGELKRQQEELAQVERLGELHAAKGTLVEHQQDLTWSAVAATVAATMLRSVADEYEQAHQPALIERTAAMARLAAPSWEGVLVRPDGDGGGIELFVQERSGPAVPTTKLSTGARALLYLALRVAMAEQDAEFRGVQLPLLCDDPLVHLDDDRAVDVIRVLKAAADAGHQVVLFTCHDRTVQAAEAAGAHVANL